MSSRWSRRSFLQAAGAVPFGLGSMSPWWAFAALPQEPVAPVPVPLDAAIEPFVRQLEATTREKCFEVVADQLRRGLGYRQLLAGLFLTGVRNFKPASTGAMHAVFMLHAAHQFSLDAPVEQRLLPLFFALDVLMEKRQQVAFHGPHDPLVPLTGTLPAVPEAGAEFDLAMKDWDGDRAERAMVVMSRNCGVAEIGEHLWSFGARDQNQIGHKAIFLANAWRTLQVIGWQHAELVLRALSLALVSHHMNYKAAALAKFDEQPYRKNVDRVARIAGRLPGDWATVGSDAGATLELLALLRDGDTDEACELAAKLLVEGKAAAASLWDAVHLAAGELMMRQPDIDGVHANTSANALHFLFRQSARTQTRLLILLQAIGWMGLFHAGMRDGGLKSVRITDLVAADIPASEQDAAREVLAAAPIQGTLANADSWSVQPGPAKAFAYAQQHPAGGALLAEARRLLLRKATEEHQYKFPAAIFEDCQLVDARWRPHLLATAVYYLRHDAEPDAEVMVRAREVLGLRG